MDEKLMRRSVVFGRCFLLFFAAIACCFSLLFGARHCKKARNFAAFAKRPAVFSWKNSEKQRRLAGAPVLS